MRRPRWFGVRKRGGGRRGVSFTKYKRAFVVGAIIMVFVLMGMPKVSATIQRKFREWFPGIVY